LGLTVENLIIGGGVYGAGVAWELARRGAGCHLIEGRQIATGASGGPGRRGVRANGRDPREIPLIRLARALWPTLHEELDCDPLYERTGHVLLIEREEDLAQAEARVVMQQGMGIACSLIPGAQVHDYEPAAFEQVRAAVFCPDDGVADHTATTHAYAAAARKAGAVIEEDTAATKIAADGGRVRAVETADGSRITVTGNLFILANSGVHDLAGRFLQLPVWPRPYQVLMSRPLGNVPLRHLVGHAHRKLALKAEPGNRVMISGGRVGRWDYDAGKGSTVEEEVAANVADAVAVFPALEGIEIEVADAGHLEAVSVDGVPIIDRLPGLENGYYGTGWCGHGWAIAPAVAKLLTSWALEDRRPKELNPFSHNRFS
jgi:sarcosine oxidase subunit beta